MQSFTCKIAQRRRNNELKQEKQGVANNISFSVNNRAIERVSEFKYLGRILTEQDDDSVCIKDNLRRARHRWNSVAKVLKREGANSKCMARFYLTIVQAVLLYGADSWCITARDLQRLNSFHMRSIRHMTGKHIRKLATGEWEYPKHKELMDECKLFDMDTYIKRRRGTLRKYLEEHRSDLLREAGATQGHSREAHKVLWWNQDWITKDEMAKMNNSLFST